MKLTRGAAVRGNETVQTYHKCLGVDLRGIALDVDVRDLVSDLQTHRWVGAKEQAEAGLSVWHR